MTPENRLAAAEAFWRDDESEAGMQHVEAVVSIARRLNFRPKSVRALPLERRAKHLAHMPEISDAIATRALIAYHFSSRRDLMGAFLDALGIAHENGLIQDESVTPPSRDKLAEAISHVRRTFAPADVNLYVQTLASLDGDTWAEAEAALAAAG